MAEIFQKRDQNIKHVELSIAAHRMRFLGIAARFEPTIAGVQHRSVWPGLIAECCNIVAFYEFWVWIPLQLLLIRKITKTINIITVGGIGLVYFM